MMSGKKQNDRRERAIHRHRHCSNTTKATTEGLAASIRGDRNVNHNDDRGVAAADGQQHSTTSVVSMSMNVNANVNAIMNANADVNVNVNASHSLLLLPRHIGSGNGSEDNNSGDHHATTNTTTASSSSRNNQQQQQHHRYNTNCNRNTTNTGTSILHPTSSMDNNDDIDGADDDDYDDDDYCIEQQTARISSAPPIPTILLSSSSVVQEEEENNDNNNTNENINANANANGNNRNHNHNELLFCKGRRRRQPELFEDEFLETNNNNNNNNSEDQEALVALFHHYHRRRRRRRRGGIAGEDDCTDISLPTTPPSDPEDFMDLSILNDDDDEEEDCGVDSVDHDHDYNDKEKSNVNVNGEMVFHRSLDCNQDDDDHDDANLTSSGTSASQKAVANKEDDEKAALTTAQESSPFWWMNSNSNSNNNINPMASTTMMVPGEIVLDDDQRGTMEDEVLTGDGGGSSGESNHHHQSPRGNPNHRHNSHRSFRQPLVSNSEPSPPAGGPASSRRRPTALQSDDRQLTPQSWQTHTHTQAHTPLSALSILRPSTILRNLSGGGGATKTRRSSSVRAAVATDDGVFVAAAGTGTDNNNNNNHTKQQSSAHHVIAFSGGIDSSLAAALVHNLVGSASASTPSSSYSNSKTYGHERATAVLGLSPAVPLDQRLLAEEVASQIGIPFEQVSTTEGTDDVYVANDGKACLACKTHLYDNLKSIADRYNNNDNDNDNIDIGCTTILYNGTNAEDLRDPTRLGLIAASDFKVRSPLEHLSKPTIRLVGKHYFGLPNWDRAAAPCLRSRLAVGVPATSDHLKAVEDAEAFVKHQLGHWDVSKSLRVRILSKNRAMIEVEANDVVDENENSAEGHRHWTLEEIRDHLEGRRGLGSSDSDYDSNNNDYNHEPPLSPWKQYFQQELGFASVDVRRFKTGSVAPKLSNSLK